MVPFRETEVGPAFRSPIVVPRDGYLGLVKVLTVGVSIWNERRHRRQVALPGTRFEKVKRKEIGVSQQEIG